MKISVLGALTLALIACGDAPPGRGQTAGSTSVTFTDVTALMRVRCQPCHTVQGLGGFLDIGTSPGDDAKAYASLVSPARGSLCVDQDLYRVVPGDPARSLVITKLEARLYDRDPPCGGSMPTRVVAPLSAEDIDIIRRWIAAGAQGPR